MTTLRIIRRTRNIFYERHDFLKEIPNAEVKMTVKKRPERYGGCFYGDSDG
jgi:hypothetical protein